MDESESGPRAGGVGRRLVRGDLNDLASIEEAARGAYGLHSVHTSPERFFQDGSLNFPWRDDLIMQLTAIDDTGAARRSAFLTS